MNSLQALSPFEGKLLHLSWFIETKSHMSLKRGSLLTPDHCKGKEMKTLIFSIVFSLFGFCSQGISGTLANLSIRLSIDVHVVYPTVAIVDPESGAQKTLTETQDIHQDISGVYTRVVHDQLDPRILNISGECFQSTPGIYQNCLSSSPVIHLKFVSVDEAHSMKDKLESITSPQHLTFVHKPVQETISREERAADPGTPDRGEQTFSDGYSEIMAGGLSVSFERQNLLEIQYN